MMGANDCIDREELNNKFIQFYQQIDDQNNKTNVRRTTRLNTEIQRRMMEQMASKNQ